MSLLYLIRHPATKPDPALPAAEWTLSAEGRSQVPQLVNAPFWAGVRAVYTSNQFKAQVVGLAAGPMHRIPHTTVPDLTEARRDSWAGPDVFKAAQQRFFAQPDQAPLPGWESAQAASARFYAAMEKIAGRHPVSESLAVVAHATVLTLYYAQLCGEPPSFAFWQTIGFAAVMVVDRATMQPVTRFIVAPYDDVPV